MTSPEGAGHRSTLLLGLPSTGKTTFLAAFWHVVDNGGVSAGLMLERLSGDRTYLNHIRDAWLGLQPVARTVPSSEQTASMLLRAGERVPVVELVIPDLAGESYERFLRERRWPLTIDQIVAGAEGLLLFLHPSIPNEPHTIDDWQALEEEISESPSDAEPEGDGWLPWDQDTIPTQARVVDLLQLVQQRAWDDRVLKLAIIISAWDIARRTASSPEAWLTGRLPLLDQFLAANTERFKVRIYGLSAQGGDLGDAEDKERLERQTRAVDRIEIVGPEVEPHDITAPVRWLMAE